ncbi:RNA polymerase sigma factor [Burkholderia diffusa]|uniref:RNA polymerase sigma factor n=1 Tax=Burkholderia diffusa TaxID=488732 RepID=UPI000752F850|nr:RNA polymerase sigma factor [Burkholderia diffusa]KVM90583.1 hypothetical protein WJ62_02990 [Burkholderia diffusa]
MTGIVIEKQAQDDAAFRDQVITVMFREHRQRLYYFIFKRVHDTEEASELMQQAFVEACQAFYSFRGQSERTTWLYGIALNLIRNHVNRAPTRRFDFCDDEKLEGMPDPSADPCEQASIKQKAVLLQRALASLPADLYKTFVMVVVEDRSYEDVARDLCIPVGTVRSRLSRSRSILRGFLERREAA